MKAFVDEIEIGSLFNLQNMNIGIIARRGNKDQSQTLLIMIK